MHKALNTKLRLGRINFINCLPVDYPLSARHCKDPDSFEFYDGSPAELNQALREARIHLAPVSSYEYLTNKALYELVPGISISSKKQADSVLFFSRQDLKQIKKIYLTNKSATSANLLKIILGKAYALQLEEIEFVDFTEDSLDYDAKLLIGDEALKAAKESYSLVLDLGEEWFKLTSLPMVFGLWAVSKAAALTKKEIDQLSEIFQKSRDKGLGDYLPDIIIEAYKKTGLSKETLVKYFNNLDYNFNEEHERSLAVFEQFLSYESR